MFQKIYFDIVGGCNARCPLCVTARTTFGQKIQQTAVPDFARALDRLIDIELAEPGTSIVGLYNWAEPMLHSDLDGISSAIAERGLFAGISTNGSKRSAFKGSTAHFREFVFSLPGWSQASQDRIHGFKHEKIVANMEASIENIRDRGYEGLITLAYHVYQFNCFDEMERAREWCAEHGVVFGPYLAYINDYEPNKALLTGTMDRETLAEVSKRIFLHYYDDLIHSQPEGWRCPQWDQFLTLNHRCEALLCCVLPEGHKDYAIGSIFDLTREEILRGKTENHSACDECMNCGVAYWAHNPVSFTAPAPKIAKQEKRQSLAARVLSKVAASIA